MKVFVVAPTLGADAPDVFPKYGHKVVRSLEDAEGIVFCGGADVSPGLYGEQQLRGTYCNNARDEHEVSLFKAHVGKKFLIGICRGAQLLNVMNGGKLWQHVNNHTGRVHAVTVKGEKEDVAFPWMVNSVHHQMLRPTAEADILATADICTARFAEHEEDSGDHADIEAVWYPKTSAFCFQPHPEFGHEATTKLFFNLLHRYV